MGERETETDAAHQGKGGAPVTPLRDDGTTSPDRAITIPGLGSSRRRPSPLSILHLQRAVGNKAVGDLVHETTPVIQRVDEDQENNYHDEDDSTHLRWGQQYGGKPYEREVNWDQRAPSTTPPNEPAEWAATRPLPLPAVLRPWRYPLGEGEYPRATNLAQASTEAFRRSWDGAATSWRAVVPAVAAYAHADRDISGTGVLGTHGLDWQSGPSGAPTDVESLTGRQTVGPDGRQVSVGSLFTDHHGAMGTSTNVSAAGVHGTVDTRRAVVSLNVARDALEAAVRGHRAHQQLYLGEKQRLSAAIRQVALVERLVERDRLEEERSQLRRKQDEAVSKVEHGWAAAEAVTLIGFGMAESAGAHPHEGAESVLIGLEIAGEAIHRAMVTAEYDKQIDQLDRKITEATTDIRAEQRLYAQAQLAAARQILEAHKVLVDTSRTDVRVKMVALQTAYQALGAAAGRAAGGGARGARIQAAIEAIPKVEVCVARIGDIVRAAQVPAYDEMSGRGFNGHRQPADFVEHIAWLKGYRDRFTPLAAPWQARLTSLRRVAQGLGPVGDPASSDASLR